MRGLNLPTKRSRPTPTSQAATQPLSMTPMRAKLIERRHPQPNNSPTTLPIWFEVGVHGMRDMGIYGTRVAPESCQPQHMTLSKHGTFERLRKVGDYVGEDTKQR